MALSCNPADIVKAAACFKCIPPTTAPLVKAYLLCQTAKIADPTSACSTPSAPTALQVLNTSNTTIKVGWKQTKNTGSFITGYKVFWGTTSGGPYTSNSGVLPTLPRNYTITGLSVGTTYFVVVVALSAVPGCQSANSTQVSGTTSGAAPNKLLNSLVHYWRLESLAGNVATDEVGTLNPAGANAGADLSVVPGIIGNGVQITGAGLVNGLLMAGPIPTDILAQDAAHSVTYQLWFNLSSNVGNHGPFSIWTTNNVNKFTFVECHPDQTVFLGYYNDAVGTRTTLSTPAVVLNSWNHLVYGYDAGNSVFWFQLNGAARVTTPMNTVNPINNGSTIFFGNLSGANEEFAGIMDEYGIWSRALSTTDVANLYNGGNGLPFAQFTT